MKNPMIQFPPPHQFATTNPFVRLCIPIYLSMKVRKRWGSGSFARQKQNICAWPLRPVWTVDGTLMSCEYDQASIDTWLYEFDAFDGPVY